ncbi:MAG TPA: Wzz/FepE/Etk N-terminal domain-containing protein, partial [Candidatus Angelobacter sp.]|nr:Wzz/FepE/Etk N-terminal domain-containing protein [Candidatus Angelobacter sp.]
LFEERADDTIDDATSETSGETAEAAPGPRGVSIHTAGKPRIAERLRLLWERRVFLAHVFWMAAVLSVILAFILPVRYESTAKLVPSENASSFSSMASFVSKATGGGGGVPGLADPSSLLGLKTPAAFYIEILKSRTVQDQLVDRFQLLQRYGKRYRKDARKRLAERTMIEEDKRSGVITLSVRDGDPVQAAAMVRAYIEAMNWQAVELNVSAARREREFLEERLKSAKEELDRSSMELSQFSSRFSVMDVDQQGRAMMDSASRVQGELIAAESELKGLEQIYSGDNVRVRSLKARVAELQVQLKKMMGSYTDPTTASKGSDDSAKDSIGPAIRTLPALGYRYRDLYRQAKIQEVVFELLTQQYEVARVQEARELPIVRIMDEPEIPEKKISPVRSLIVGSSVCIALLLACLWVVEKHRWDGLSIDDPRRLLVKDMGEAGKTVGKTMIGKFGFMRTRK